MQTHAHKIKVVKLTINVAHDYGGWILLHADFEL